MSFEWLVVRLDDNGNEVVMAEFATEEEAHATAVMFEARPQAALHGNDAEPARVSTARAPLAFHHRTSPREVLRRC